MRTTKNVERARLLYEDLSGNRHYRDWIAVIVKVLAFLLLRYINDD